MSRNKIIFDHIADAIQDTIMVIHNQLNEEGHDIQLDPAGQEWMNDELNRVANFYTSAVVADLEMN